jgi:hypothetical protein
MARTPKQSDFSERQRQKAEKAKQASIQRSRVTFFDAPMTLKGTGRSTNTWSSSFDLATSDSQAVKVDDDPPMTYSLDGWFQGLKITVADIEIDESPISAVIDAVFHLDPNLEEEITAVSITDKDGNTRIVSWAEINGH